MKISFILSCTCYFETSQTLDDKSDSLVGTLNLADGGNYQNMLKLSEIASVSPVGLTEAERAASTLPETDRDLFI